MMKNIDTRVSIYKKALEVSWLAAIFLIPLFFNPLSHYAFYLNKALLFQFLVFVMLAFTIADWIYSKSSLHRISWKQIVGNPLQLSILVFGLLAIIATVASITPAISFWGSLNRVEGLLTLLCWILFFLILAHNLRHREQLFRAIYTLLLSSAVVSILGILEYYFPEAMYHLFHTALGGRSSSTTGNVLSLSAFLAMVIPLTLAFIVRSWNQIKEGRNNLILAALIVLLVLQFWCLWLAQYSVTILLFIIAPIIFITLLGIVKRKKIFLSLGLTCLLALGIIATLIVIPMLLPGAATKKSDVADSSAIITPEELGLITIREGRIQYWRSAIDIILKTPEVPFSNDSLNPIRAFIGYGPETFIITFQSVFPEELKSSYTSVSSLIDRPHNHYLYLATTIGLLGLASFIAILVLFFYLSWRYLRSAKLEIDRLLLIAIVAGMVQYMADSLFNPSTLSAELVFWLMLALVPIMGRLVSSNSSIQDEVGQQPVKVREIIPSSARARTFMSIFCLVLLVASGIMLTIGPFRADMELQRGLKLQAERSPEAVFAFSRATEIQPGRAAYWGSLAGYAYEIALYTGKESIKTDLLTYSTYAYEKAIEMEPYISYWYLFLADEYTYWAQIGANDKWSDALSLYDKGLQLFPDNAVILNKWSLALIIKGDFSEARTKLEYAASVDPDWVETSFLSGLLLAEEGKDNEATQEIITTIQERPSNLSYFDYLCYNLIVYDMVYPLGNVLESYTQEIPSEWIPHAMLGITDFYSVGLDESIDEFNTAMSLVPDEDAGVIFRVILGLSDLSPNFKMLLPDVANEWRDKLAQSPDRDILLPLLDELIDTSD